MLRFEIPSGPVRLTHPFRSASAGLALLVLVGGTVSCRPAPTKSDSNTTAGAAPSVVASDDVARFGAVLGNLPRHALAEVLADPNKFGEAPLQVEGYVRRACSRKGCWMELAAGPETALPGCRVTFKDYAFFVPTDSAGSRARVEGQLKVRRVNAQRVAHYEAEGAAFASKRPDGSADEVQFVATGVELRR